jgi:anaerobic magnesium-protoporphyrin IX monomethyl ester cyclase
MDMKFLLLYPPPESFFIHRSRIFYGLSPPLGLLYIAQILENHGDNVSLIDFSAEPFNQQKLLHAIQNIDAIGISVLSSSLPETKKIIELIRQQKPTLPIIIGGPHCTLCPEQALKETNATLCLQGDSEMILSDLREALNNKKEFSEIPGAYYKKKDIIMHGPPPKLTEELDNIPFPARHLVKHYTYGREYNPKLKAGEFTSIITSRGCPYNCRFCSRGSISMQRYRTRSLENILSELREIKEQGYRHVVFSDDCFPANKKLASHLFDVIIKEDLSLKFSVTATRVDLADQHLYKKMRKAGVTHMQFGLESGNQEVLDFYHKNTTLQNIRNAVQLSNDTGFFTIGSFIFGAPFETTDHFNKTVQFAKSLPLDSVSFLPLRYMIGSELWTEAVNQKKIQEYEYLVSADKNRGLGNYTKDELFKLCIQAQHSFYFRPTFFINLLKKSLHNDDLSYVQSYLLIASSSIKESILFKRNR